MVARLLATGTDAAECSFAVEIPALAYLILTKIFSYTHKWFMIYDLFLVTIVDRRS